MRGKGKKATSKDEEQDVDMEIINENPGPLPTKEAKKQYFALSVEHMAELNELIAAVVNAEKQGVVNYQGAWQRILQVLNQKLESIEC